MKIDTKSLAALIGFFLFVSICNAQRIYLSNSFAKYGDTVDIPIIATNFYNIGSFTFEFFYDSTQLVYDTARVKKCNSSGVCFLNPNLKGIFTAFASDTSGLFRCSWVDTANYVLMDDSIELFRIPFIFKGKMCVSLNFNGLKSSATLFNSSENIYLFGSYSQVCNYNCPMINNNIVNNYWACDSDNMQFSVTALSNFPLSYQWLYNSSTDSVFKPLINSAPFSGVNDSILKINPATFNLSSYNYECQIWNKFDTVISNKEFIFFPFLYPVELEIDYGYLQDTSGLCIGDTVRLSNSLSCPNIKYEWKKNGVDIPGATNSYYTAKTTGNYQLFLNYYSYSDSSIVFPLYIHDCIHIGGICYTSFNCTPWSDSLIQNVKVALYRNNQLYGLNYTDINGTFIFNPPDSGQYYIKVDSILFGNLIVNCSNATIPIPDSSGGAAISYTCYKSSSSQLGGFMSGVGFIPGRNAFVYIDYTKESCSNVNGQIKLVCNTNNGTFINADNINGSPGIISADTVSWNVNNVVNTLCNYAVAEFTVSTSARMNDTVCFYAVLTADSSHNKTVLKRCFPVKSSWDPNDKQVYPLMSNSTGIYPDSTLIYTIDFQNTGNADAQNVTITDVINKNLDITTLSIITSSSPVTISISKNNNGNYVVTFTLSNINLPYEAENEMASHGFVTYSIKPQKNLENGTVITNTASIVFDYNPPIITNTLENIVTVGIHELAKAYIHFTFSPNPVSNELLISSSVNNTSNYNISICDIRGKSILNVSTTSSSGTIKLNTYALPSGMYILKISSNDNSFTQYNKFIKL